MEDEVKDAILEEGTKDPHLKALLNIVLASIEDRRPVFLNLQDEPVLFRNFTRWVDAGIKEAQAAAQALKKAEDGLNPTLPSAYEASS